MVRFCFVQGIIVKITTRQLGDNYHNEKGRVVSLVSQFCAIVKMLETGQKIKLDQAHVETVIPAPGKCQIHGLSE